MAEFDYVADGDVLRDFFSSDEFVRLLRGPVGSGKSVACCVEIFRRAVGQAKSPRDGKRKTRWAVIRNTGPELRTTTIKTWLEWFPEKIYGKFNWQPPFTHHIRRGELDCEVIFLALDKPDDVKKLLSLELTGGFINEAREVPKEIVDGLTQRCGRYPAEIDGGPTWTGAILDTNSPEDDHWWPVMAGDTPPPEWMTEQEIRRLVKPSNWRFFSQPGAMFPEKNEKGEVIGYVMNPKRENQIGVKDIYYQRMIPGKTENWINVYVCNRYGTIQTGKPVYPMFNINTHKAKDWLLPVAGLTIYAGIDFGLTPAAVFGQKPRGQWHILRELVAGDMGTTRFAVLMRELMMELGGTYSVWGDPTGDSRVQTDEDTPFRVLRAAGIMCQPAHSNDPVLRIGAVEAPLTRMVDGTPGMIVDPRCTNIIKGFETGYQYKRMHVSGEKYEDKPDKNRFSHPHDALQYLMLGAGEGRALMRSATGAAPVVKARNWDVFGQKPRISKPSFLKGW